MDLRDDGSDPEEPGLGIESSEHILQRTKKSAKNDNFLHIGGKDGDDNDSNHSDGSHNKTMVKSASGNLREGKTFRRKLCPRPELYLDKTQERPKRLQITKFLPDNYFENTVLACYQRSGSTLLRRYIENITGIFTGSDGDVHTKLDKQLKDSGLEGESILGHKVWIAQTNFPEETGNSRTTVNKSIVLVRNPCDSIYSFFNMLAKKDINEKLTKAEFDELTSEWEDFVDQEIKVWRDFYQYWVVEPLIPTYVVRYEDLITAPQKILQDLFAFLLNRQSISGTLIDSLIKQECTSENKDYYKQNKPFYASGMFTDSQLEYIRQQAGQYLLRFGYVSGKSVHRGQLAPTNFFDNADLEDSAQYEKDTLIRNSHETNVNVRLSFDDLNHEQHKMVTEKEYLEKFEERQLPELEINLDIENIRKKGVKEMSARAIFRKHK